MPEITEEELARYKALEADAEKAKQAEQKVKTQTDIAKEAEADVKAKAEAAELSKFQEKAIRFNMGIDTFFDKNGDMLGSKEYADSVKSLLNDSAKREELETGKACVRAKGILDIFVKKQENIDGLPESAKERVRAWEVMSEGERHAKALTYFDDIIGVAETLRAAKAKNKQLEIKNGETFGMDTWEKRNFEAAKQFAPKFE